MLMLQPGLVCMLIPYWTTGRTYLNNKAIVGNKHENGGAYPSNKPHEKKNSSLRIMPIAEHCSTFTFLFICVLQAWSLTMTLHGLQQMSWFFVFLLPSLNHIFSEGPTNRPNHSVQPNEHKGHEHTYRHIKCYFVWPEIWLTFCAT